MRSLLTVLLVLGALAVPAGLVAGCGSEDLPSVSAADAAAATRAAETARITMRMEARGMGLPKPLVLTAEGVTATEGLTMDVTLDFGEMLRAFAADGDGEARILVADGEFYLDPPDVEGLDLPDGASWVTADAGEVARAALGRDADGLGDLMRMSTEQQLDALRAADSMRKVGEEEIDGENTSHLKGTVSLDDYLRVLPPERRRRIERTIARLEALPGGDLEDLRKPSPVEIWVDADRRIRRIRQDAKIPAQEGVAAGSFLMTIDYTDFGTPLDVEPPDGDDVWDATDKLKKAAAEGG